MPYRMMAYYAYTYMKVIEKHKKSAFNLMKNANLGLNRGV